MKTLTIKSTCGKLAALTIAASAIIPFVASGATWNVTNTFNGVTVTPASTLQWRAILNDSSHTATLGYGGNNGRANAAIQSWTGDQLVLPLQFTVDGENYTVTAINGRGFYYTYMKSMVVHDTIVNVATYGFGGCNKMVNLMFKGKPTVANGATQNYTACYFGDKDYPVFNNCSALKLVVLGPNFKPDRTTARTNFTLPSSSNAVVLVPRRSDNNGWNGLSLGGTDNTVIYYGPDEECGYDFWMGETTITAVPRTLEAMQTVNGYASTFKTAFSHDTRFAITNSIGTLTSDIYSGAGIDAMGEGEITFGLAAAFTGGVTANGSSVVSVNAGCRPGNGAVTLDGAATLKVAQSGTVTLGGALTAADGTTLAFNFTDATTAPTLAVATSANLPADGTVNVKVTSDDGFAKGSYTLVSGAGLTAGDLSKFAMNSKLSDDWRGTLSVVDGNLVLKLKPKPGLMIIVK